jgi:hypothetical protein
VTGFECQVLFLLISSRARAASILHVSSLGAFAFVFVGACGQHQCKPFTGQVCRLKVLRIVAYA